MSKSELGRLLRSGASGATGSVFDFASMVVFVELVALTFAPAAAAASMIGAGVCFFLNRRWAFRDRTPLGLRQVGAFVIVAIGAAVINAGVVHLLAGMLRVAYLGAKAVSACVVFATWTYPVQARLVFAPRSQS